MSESTRPSMKAVQKSLLVGGLVGLIIGVILGIVGAAIYVNLNPPVYQGGAYPNELTNAYQKHYLAMVIDSYIINQEDKVAQERLKSFNDRPVIQALAERSAAYVAAGRPAEAQRVNALAAWLKTERGWNDGLIESVISDLVVKYQQAGDVARSQAMSTFSMALLNGNVPVPAETAPPQQAQPPAQEEAGEAPPSGGVSWWLYLLCCLVLIFLIVLIIYLLGKRRAKAPTRPPVEWEGEGPAPLKVWSSTYELGQDTYDEFFTIETEDNVFLGECGMAIMDAVPNTSPKQVLSFDVGLFDKTDITTRSQHLMSEYAYNDETLRMKVDANPQAEPVLAEPGKTFSFESSAMRVEGKIEEMEYGEGGNKYFSKLKVRLHLFVKEGADLRKGEMDVPDQYK